MKRLIVGGATYSLIMGILVAACATTAFGVDVPARTVDFSSTVYMDPATTADWNTGAGRLGLFPFALQQLYATSVGGDVQDVDVDGDLVYVACGTGGLAILRDHTVFGSVVPGGEVLKVKADGNLVYLANNDLGLRIVDATQLASPVIASTYTAPGGAHVLDADVDGEHVFTAEGVDGIEVIDASDPTAPHQLGSFDDGTSMGCLAVAGDMLFVGTGGNGVLVLDITDPTKPTPMSRFGTGMILEIELVGSRAYLAARGDGLLIYDVANPKTPVLLGSSTMTYARSVAVSGDMVLVGDRIAGAKLFDISDPSTPVLVDEATGVTDGVALLGDRAFVCRRTGDLYIYKFAEVMPPVMIWSEALPSTFGGMEFDGNRLYVRTDAGLSIYDVANEAAPTLLGSLALDSRNFVTVKGYWAYATYGTGLAVIDISDPSNPSLRGTYDDGTGYYKSLHVEGDIAYACGSSSVNLIDLTLPTAPSLIGTWSTSEPYYVSGNLGYAWELSGTERFEILDITDPLAPVTMGTYDDPDYYYLRSWSDPLFDGRRAYFSRSTYQDGDYVWRLNYEDPTSIQDPGYSGWQPEFDTIRAGLLGQYIIGYLDYYGGVFAADVGTRDVQTRGTGEMASHVLLDGSHMMSIYGTELRMHRTFQSEYRVEDADLGLSLPLDDADDVIVRARIAGAQCAGVDWTLLNEHQSTPVDEIGPWLRFDPVGTDIAFEARIRWAGPDIVPGAESITVEWLNEYPLIEVVEDIPDDQGGQVGLFWHRSGYDFVGDANPITEYAVFRQVDPLAKSLPEIDTTGLSRPAAAQVEAQKAAGWYFVTTVPARCEDGYAIVAPTLADSTITGGMHQSVFKVSALTSTIGLFYDSPPDSGYSADNLAPSVPTSLLLEGDLLSWGEPVDADFDYFTVYGSDDDEFGAAVLVDNSIAPVLDLNGSTWSYYFVTATDFAGNESEAATLDAVSSVPDPAVTAYALFPNHPNPFNPQTTIAFELPEQLIVRLTVFDVSGRIVNVLVDDELVEQGRNEVVWRGRDMKGRNVSAGIYFYRLEAGEFSQTKKMTLVK